MNENTLIIENHAFPAHRKSTARDERDRKEEDLAFGARDTLEELRRHPIPPYFREKYGIDSWQGWILFCSRHVARHYGLDKDAVITSWVRHYGVGLIYPKDWTTDTGPA